MAGRDEIRYSVGFDVQQENLKQLKASLDQLKKQLNDIKNVKLGDLVKINNTDRDTARKYLTDIQNDAAKVEDALRQAFSVKLNAVNINQFNRILQSSGTSLQQVRENFRLAGAQGDQAFRSLTSSVLRTNTQLRQSHAILDKVASTLTRTLGWNLASSAVNSMTRSVQQAWGYVKSLDTSLNNISIVTGKSADQMADFAVKANSAAQALGKTTTDYTEAALIYAQQGLSDKEIEERTAITLKTANVTGQSTQAVSEELTAVWNGYKANAEEAELYVDRLAAVAATTASDLEELSTGMSKVASAAAAMGVGEDQLAAQLSTIISVTRQAPESVGTALRTVYARISDIQAGIDEEGVSLGNYSGKMAALGFDVLDATGHLRDMGTVMEEIGNKWQDLTREQQVNLAQVMAGQRQYSNLIALFDNFEQYNKALETAQNAEGTLQKQQDTYMESTAAHLNKLKAATENIYDSLIDTDAMDGVIDVFTTLANAAAGFIDSLGGGGQILRDLGSIGMMVFSTQLANGINTFITNYEKANFQAEQFRATLNQIQELQAKESNPIDKSLLGNQQQLMRLSRFMTPEQSAMAQGAVDKLKNDISEMINISERLNKIRDDARDAGIEFKNLGDITDDNVAKLKSLDLRPILDQLTSSGKGDTEVLENAKAIGESIGHLIEQGLIQSSDGVQAALSKITQLPTELQSNQTWDDLINHYKTSIEELKTALSNQGVNVSFITDLEKNLSSGNINLANLQEQLVNFQRSAQSGSKAVQEMGNNFQRAFSIESVVKLTGSMSSLVNVTRQLSNIGNIIADNSLSPLEIVGQTISNLLTSVSMGLPALQRLYDALSKINLVRKSSTVVTAAQTVATKAQGRAAREAAQAETQQANATRNSADANNTDAIAAANNAQQTGAKAVAAETAGGTAAAAGGLASLAGPITVAIGAFVLLTSVIGGVNSYLEKQREELNAERQAQIDEQKEKQASIEKNQEMIDSIEELNNQYRNGEITRSEMIRSIKELTEQYGLEKDAIDQLVKSYNNLEGYTSKERAEKAMQAARSASIELDNANQLLLDAANHVDNKLGYKQGNQYSIKFGPNKKADEGLEQQVQKILQENNLDFGGGNGAYIVEATAEGILQGYDKIEKIRKQAEELIANTDYTWDQIKDTSIGSAIKWAEEMSEQAQQAKASLEKQHELAGIAYSSAAMADSSNTADFTGVNNAADYIRQRSILISETERQLQQSDDALAKGIDASEAVSALLQQHYKSLYTSYDTFAKYMEDAQKDIGEGPSEEIKKRIENAIANMDEAQLAAVMQVDPADVKNWEFIADSIQRISKADLDHTAAILDTNPEALQQSAAQAYSKYQDIEDKVRDGKGLNKTEFKVLQGSGLEEYFTQAANGSYKLTVSLKDFIAAIDDKKVEGFANNLDLINREIEKNQAIAAKGYNKDFYNSIDQSQMIPRADYAGAPSDVYQYLENKEVNYSTEQAAKNALDYLDTLSVSDDVLAEHVRKWRELIDQQGVTRQVARQIFENVDKYGDQTQEIEEKLNKLNQDYLTAAHAWHDAMFPTDSDIEQSAVQQLSDVLQGMADTSIEIDNDLDEDTRAADDLAEAILRFDDAITDVTDNYDDWMAALSSGAAQDQAAVINDLRDAYADLLDLDGSSLSQGFLKSADNLQLMKAAIEGNTDAYDQLMSIAQQDIATQVGLDTSQFDAGFDHLMDLYYQGQSLDDMAIGASLDNQDFLDGLSNMVDAAFTSAQQAQDYLASMGVDAEVIEQDNQTEETNETAGFHPQEGGRVYLPYSIPFANGQLVDFKTPSNAGEAYVTGVQYVPDPVTVTTKKQNKAFSLKVIGAHKSSGGGFKYSQASHGGGSKKATPKSSGGKGGGGKGSGGKAPEPDTSQKDRKKDMEDTRDIYHDINIELEQINRRLDRAQKKQDRLYGKQLLDNLNEQTKILEQHKAALEEKHKLQEQDLKNQQETLKNLGVTFDEYGNISNYMSILGQKQAEINARTKEYNSLIDAYNASTDKDLKKAISEEAEKLNKKIKEYEDDYKKLEKKIKDYDGLREDMEDVVDQIEEETQKQIEINIKKFRMAIEIRLEMGDAERDWNQFRREVLEHSDVLKGTDFEKIFADARQNMRDVFSYFDVHGTKGTLQALTEQLMNTRAEIEAINETGKSAIYGDNKAQAMEDLQKDLDELMGQMEDVEKLIDDIGEAYLDTIDDIADQFDEQIEDYEYIGDLIEHDIDLLQLLYGDKNYDAMQKYYDTLTQNNLRQLDSLRQQRDFWKQEWDMAVARGDTQAAKAFEENYKETIENLNDAVEDAAKNIQDKYINAIDKIFDELDKKITNGKGTDYLSTEWDLMNKNAEEYLDTINSAFAIQETERKYQKAIDENKNIKNQQTLKKLMDDQLGILRNKEKVSQYDVDRAEKLLQVEQARMALQDAQSAKTTMRLKRDSQGNYSYQYVADNNAVDDARDNLAQAQNDLYNFDKERYQSVLDDMLNAWKDFQSDYKDILEDTSLTEQDRIERLALLREEYGEYINDKTAQNMEARQNLMESAFADLAALYSTDVANYNQMSADEQNILMNDLVPTWESGIQQMSDKVAGEGGFIPACEEAFDDITEKTKEYEEQLDNMANAAGISLDYVTQGVDLLSDAFMDLVEDNDELIDRMYTEVDAIQTLQDAARELVNEYQNIYNEAKTAVSEIHNFIQQEQGRAAAYADTANVAIDSYNRTARAYVDAYDQMASAVENYAARVRAAVSGDGSGGGSGSGGSGGTGGSSPSGSNNSSQGTSRNLHTTPGYAYLVDDEIKHSGSYFASGGYTGQWNDNRGKIAVLHQKELVLNEDDTKNFLEGTHILREISSSLQGSLSARMDNMRLGSLMSTDKEELEQNVHIEASFPNVNSKKEIEEALNDLVNLAAQRAMRR